MSARRQIAVLVNPDAGTGPGSASQPSGRASALERIAGSGAYVRTVATPAELAAFAAEACAREVDTVAVCGGDGTLGRVATAVDSAYASEAAPALAPLGGGTMNTIARSLGLSRPRPESLLAQLVGGGDGWTRRRQGTIRVLGDRLGMLVGAGVPARFLSLYEEGEVLGARRAVAVLVPLIASALSGGGRAERLFGATAIEAWLDDEPQALERAALIYAATVDDIGLGFRPTARAREVEGRFQCLLGDVRPIDLVRALPAIWRGRGVSGERWVDACASRLRVVFAEPTVYMVDGDVEGSVVELDLRSGPVFDFLIGASRRH